MNMKALTIQQRGLKAHVNLQTFAFVRTKPQFTQTINTFYAYLLNKMPVDADIILE